MTEWRRGTGVLSDVVDGRAVLIGPGGQEVITLNGVGSAVWDWLATPSTAEELAGKVVDRFADVDQATASRDVSAFLHELAEAGLAIAGS